MSEEQRVRSQNLRARALGAIATLTVTEWTQTLSDFHQMCAYCLSKPFDVLEHFLPIQIGGTTVNNCVPACYQCNYKKSDRAGDSLIEVFGAHKVHEIAQYLKSRTNKADSFVSKQVQRRSRWSTKRKDLPQFPLALIHRMLEEKETYTLRELIENLPISLREFGRKYDLSEVTIAHLRDGKPAMRSTINKLLAAMSETYSRHFSLYNVQEIIIRDEATKKRTKAEEHASA